MDTPQDDLPKPSEAESKQDVTIQPKPLASEGSDSALHSSLGSEVQSPPSTKEASGAAGAGAVALGAAEVRAATKVESDPPPIRPDIGQPVNITFHPDTTFTTPLHRASLEDSPSPPDAIADEAIPLITEQAFTRASVGDTATDKDSIGFEPYVQAVAEFLADPRTESPLTISVEGEWGAGKSSFMMQLSRALRERGIESIEFNAWRHDKDESLWAAFALEFSREVSNKLWLVERPWAKFRLFCKRLRKYDIVGAWRDLARVLLMLGFYLPLAVFCFIYLADVGWPNLSLIKELAAELSKDPTKFGHRLGELGGVTASIFFLLFFLNKLVKIVGDPLAIDLRKYGRWPDYETRLAFLERFHFDLAHIAQVYTKGQRFCVFIDDLDRCEVPKSADMMQAINLMIPECKNLIFVIGMDRERVAAAVAVKHEKLIPYLARASVAQVGLRGKLSDNKGEVKSTVDSQDGLAYGYGFLEKFIQIPFRLPQADRAGVNSLLNELLRDRNISRQPSWRSRVRSWWKGITREFKEAVVGSEASLSREASTTPPGKQTSPLKESFQRSERQVTDMVAPALDYNPRRLKQVLNSYRLKAYIAYMTDILDVSEGAPQNGRLSLPQVAKFVAISLRWPHLLSSLDEDRQLLSRLQRMAIKERRPSPIPDLSWTATAVPSEESVSEELSPWSRDKALMGLLFEGCLSSHNEPRFSLQIVDLDRLLRISPRRKEPAMDIQASRDT